MWRRTGAGIRVALRSDGKRRDRADEGLKQLVARNKIGFGIDLDDSASLEDIMNEAP